MNVIYVRPDGFIAKRVTNATVIQQIQGLDPVIINSACNIARQYYLNGELLEKQRMSLIYQSQGSVGEQIQISGIPDNTEVIWPDGIKTMESGSISFDANTQGDYVFRFSNAPYFNEKVSINVT